MLLPAMNEMASPCLRDLQKMLIFRRAVQAKEKQDDTRIAAVERIVRFGTFVGNDRLRDSTAVNNRDRLQPMGRLNRGCQIWVVIVSPG